MPAGYVMPHPPLAVPEVGDGKETVICETVQAMDDAAAEIARLKPETIIYITPHGTVFGDYFHISPGKSAAGNFSRFGAALAEGDISAEYDEELIAEISRAAAAKNFPAGTPGERDAALDHGVLVPMYYVNRRFSDYRAIRVSPSGLDAAAHFEFGGILAEAAAALGRRVVVIASGDLSHKLSKNGPYGYAPEGEIFDSNIMKYLADCDFDALLSMDKKLRENAAECGYGSFAILAGFLKSKLPGRPEMPHISARQLSYECPFGVGYGVVKFAIEDAYRALARRSLETRVKTGRDLSVTASEIPDEMRKNRAGAFVSLHMNGQLRGCIGTIAPTADCIAAEITQNAVSAGLYDSRFPPVREDDLPLLSYKVDILDAPEEIPDASHLDVKKYGVIVESGFKRGLLLPNLEGVDTVDYQLEIACQKAGISRGEKFSLQRFKVTRYE